MAYLLPGFLRQVKGKKDAPATFGLLWFFYCDDRTFGLFDHAQSMGSDMGFP